MLDATDPLLRKFVTNLTPDEIPDGLCKCGCGLSTTFPRQNETRRGYRRSKPTKYAYHHNRSGAGKKPFYIVNELTGCWEWQRSGYDGYGNVRAAGRSWKAHILYYTLLRGEVPAGHTLDHLCRNTNCVNPDHLEPVTQTENVRRGKCTKLNADQVQEIRRLYADGHGGYRTIAKQFGVTGPQIRKIVKNLSWVSV